MINNICGVKLSRPFGAPISGYILPQGSRRAFSARSPWAIDITFPSERFILISYLKNILKYETAKHDVCIRDDIVLRRHEEWMPNASLQESIHGAPKTTSPRSTHKCMIYGKTFKFKTAKAVCGLVLLFFFFSFFLIGCNSTTNPKYNIEAANINAKLGTAYLQQNKIEFAKKKLLLALKQAPHDPTVHNALGYFFAHTGEPTLAEKHYLYAIKRAKEKGVIWNDYGIFLYKQNRYQEALKYFLDATKDINYLAIATAYANASKAAAKLKKFYLAQKLYKNALAHNPNFDS